MLYSRIFVLSLLVASFAAYRDPSSNLTYSTKGHPKAEGLNLEISYPRDWIAMETHDLPAVIQKISPPDNDNITLKIYLMDKIGTFRFHDGQNDSFDSYILNSNGTMLHYRWISYYFEYGSKLAVVMFSVIAPSPEESARLMDIMKPLFTEIARSVTLPEKEIESPFTRYLLGEKLWRTALRDGDWVEYTFRRVASGEGSIDSHAALLRFGNVPWKTPFITIEGDTNDITAVATKISFEYYRYPEMGLDKNQFFNWVVEEWGPPSETFSFKKGTTYRWTKKDNDEFSWLFIGEKEDGIPLIALTVKSP